MGRDIDSNDRPQFNPDRPHPDREERPVTTAPALSRDLRPIPERGYTYQISPAELETMREIGRFRTVAIDDLGRNLYQGNTAQMREDLRFLRDQGLVQLRTARTRAKGKLPVAVLTKAGKDIAAREGHDGSGQELYAGFVKPGEVAHDAAIYRMYQAEAAQIEKAGGKIRRVILDYELKQKIYAPLAKAKANALPSLEYARKQAEVARENGLTVVDGKIPLSWPAPARYETDGLPQHGSESEDPARASETDFRPLDRLDVRPVQHRGPGRHHVHRRKYRKVDERRCGRCGAAEDRSLTS